MSIARMGGMKAKALAVGQGIFYIFSGLWPIVHYRSFEKVTGPKTDDWLVKTTGGLIAMAGLSILRAGLRSDLNQDLNESSNAPHEAAIVGAGHALILGTSAGYYSLIGRISKVYLFDAVTEYALVGAWLVTALKPGSRNSVVQVREEITYAA